MFEKHIKILIIKISKNILSCPFRIYLKPVRGKKQQAPASHQDFSKFRGAFGVLHFEKSSNLAKSEEKPCLTCNQNDNWTRPLSGNLSDFFSEQTQFIAGDNILNIFLQVIALKVKRNGDWKTWTYERYLREVELVARGFIHVGMSRHRSVAIIGQNSPEWVISDLAAIFSGKTRTSNYYYFSQIHDFNLVIYYTLGNFSRFWCS